MNPNEDLPINLLRRPSHLEHIQLGMSNFDHTIDNGFEDALRCGQWGQHFALEFNGEVWFADDQFHEDVWRSHMYRETISATSLKELMDSVNNKWGYA